MNVNDEYVKVTFPLKRDKNGYPPTDYESIWTKKNNENHYIIDNIPFYIYGISKGDSVIFHLEQGEYFVSKITQRGGHSTFRVYVFNQKNLNSILKKIQQLGCFTSSSTNSTYFSLDVPPSIDLSIIDNYLSNLTISGIIEYEDACIQHKGISKNRKLECESLFNIIFKGSP
ncbi:DUF4265 domain-containing protein [Zophobihabitans entericus]|uniref:DUF4265 domain-containing protein n=1 Tax=Zophobihabitans entericus TaxID=1635327 RepID=A0A6G9IB32_9GAMM|nr:DUF4265 domain-containing protein [Zophobihabitans entericus]QIQ21436.1 DUF4265 domain-containing protein [Zophobihabitans entericus]